MGYRSQVVIVLDSTVEIPEQIQKDLLGVFATSCSVSKSGQKLYHRDYIKWYDEFPDPEYADIQRIMEWINSIEDDDSFLFARIGEDSSDTDYRGCMWDNDFGTGIVHRIEFEKNPE